MNEFEFYIEDGYTLAVPFCLEDATSGEDLDDAVQSASDWLHETINGMLVKGIEPSFSSFSNKPLRGGKIIAVSVSCDLSKVDAVSAAEAARILGAHKESPPHAEGFLTSGHMLIRHHETKVLRN